MRSAFSDTKGRDCNCSSGGPSRPPFKGPPPPLTHAGAKEARGGSPNCVRRYRRISTGREVQQMCGRPNGFTFTPPPTPNNRGGLRGLFFCWVVGQGFIGVGSPSIVPVPPRNPSHFPREEVGDSCGRGSYIPSLPHLQGACTAVAGMRGPKWRQGEAMHMGRGRRGGG